MTEVFDICDALGPEKIIHIHNEAAGLRAIVVIDNTAIGPAIGGVRMAPDVTLSECARLARAMTLKNAAAGLTHGGAKSVIVASPTMKTSRKEALMRAFAQAIEQIADYIPGPDMGTNETCMAWIQDENSRAVGLPRVIGGIPLDDIGATGFGVSVAAEVAQNFCGVDLAGARVAIQGFGAVGKHAALNLAEKGARIVAVSDSRGAVFDQDCLDLSRLLRLKADNKGVCELAGAHVAERDAVIAADCDILIPAARPDIIDDTNAADVRAKLIVQGANIPVTATAEDTLHKRGVLMVPDFIANAGGVICASVEFHGGTENLAMTAIEEKIRRNTMEVLQQSRDEAIMPRQAANKLAATRIREAMALRRFYRNRH